MAEDGTLLEVVGLEVRYGDTPVLHGVDLTLRRGDTLAVVGESGSGKSTLVHAILGLLPDDARVTAGEIRFEGERIDTAGEARLAALRGRRIGLVPQDPLSNLDPLIRVGAQVVEGPRAHGLLRRRDARQRAVDVLGRVHLPDPARDARRYPHQLSGGMRQRALIGAGIASGPSLLLADEPTSALDVTVQRGVLDTIDALVHDGGIGLLHVTHDLALAAERSTHLLVLRGGRVVDFGPSAEVVRNPTSDYTAELLAAAPHHRTTPYGARAAGAPRAALLEVDGVTRAFSRSGRPAVDDVGFSIAAGETVALVGESGSGKSTIANVVLGFERPDAGRIRFDGTDVTGFATKEAAALRRRIQPVFQDPGSSLNPRFDVLEAVTEPLRIARRGGPAERRRRAHELLDAVALPRSVADRNVRRLSGGQKQRVAIARALALEPSLLVCDEAVSALDVLVQEQILELLGALQRELGLAALFITHDLSVARWIADRVVVLRHGRIVEQGDAADVFERPSADHTKELLGAVPGRAA